MNYNNSFKKIFFYVNYLFLFIKGNIGIDTVHLPYESVWIPPYLIENIVRNPHDSLFTNNSLKLYKIGQISDGDWDIKGELFDELDVFISLKERFVNGKKWEDTQFYNRVKNEIEIGHKIKWDCSSLKEFDQRLNHLDDVYKNIKINGYKKQKQLSNINPFNEIQVAVSRDGNVIFIDGRHRLSIAKILNLEQIPVIVTVWHKNYVKQIRVQNKKYRLSPKNLIQPIILDFIKKNCSVENHNDEKLKEPMKVTDNHFPGDFLLPDEE